MGYPPFVFNMEWMGYVTNSTFFYGSVWSPFLMDMFGWRLIHQLLNNPGNHDGDETSFGRYNEGGLISGCDFMLKITWRWWDVYLTWLHDWALRSKVDVLELYPQMFLPWNWVSSGRFTFWKACLARLICLHAILPSYHPTAMPQRYLPGDGEPTYSGYNACLNNIEYMLVFYHQIIHTNIWDI